MGWGKRIDVPPPGTPEPGTVKREQDVWREEPIQDVRGPFGNPDGTQQNRNRESNQDKDESPFCNRFRNVSSTVLQICVNGCRVGCWS